MQEGTTAPSLLIHSGPVHRGEQLELLSSRRFRPARFREQKSAAICSMETAYGLTRTLPPRFVRASASRRTGRRMRPAAFYSPDRPQRPLSGQTCARVLPAVHPVSVVPYVPPPTIACPAVWFSPQERAGPAGINQRLTNPIRIPAPAWSVHCCANPP